MDIDKCKTNKNNKNGSDVCDVCGRHRETNTVLARLANYQTFSTDNVHLIGYVTRLEACLFND